jgi:hypothetical protein
MTEPEPAVDLSGLFDFDAARERKRARQIELAKALTATPEAEPVDEELARRVDSVIERLDELDGQPVGSERVNAFTAATAGTQQRGTTLLDALLGRTPPRGGELGPARGFDGGARRTPPPVPETHAETLGRLLRSREADVGRAL